MFYETGLKDISSKLGLQTIQVSASNSIAIFWQRLQFVHTRGSMDIFGSEGSSGFIRFPGTQILKLELEEGKGYMEEALAMIRQQNEPVLGVAPPPHTHTHAHTHACCTVTSPVCRHVVLFFLFLYNASLSVGRYCWDRLS